MNHLRNNPARLGLLVLGLLLATALLASCGGDDPAAPADTNQAPAAPVIDTVSGAPSHGAVDVGLAVELHWTCGDPDDDALTYTVRFGTEAEPPVVAQGHVSTSYEPAALVHSTNYNWQIVAEDDGGKTTAGPVWTFTTAAASLETVGAPDTPVGPANGQTGQSLNYTSNGAVSSQGHEVEYSFDWGDGLESTWTNLGSRSHTWDTPGTYQVRVRARCGTHTDVLSDWSTAYPVTIALAPGETVSAPNVPNLPATGETNQTLTITVSGGTSSMGHTLQYRLDYGDGTVTNWFAAAATFQHAWATADTWQVTAQARCLNHPDLESAWSAAAEVVVSDPVETIVSPPGSIWGVTAGAVDEPYDYDCAHSSQTSLGDPIEWRFDWGDGTYSDWSTAATHSTAHSWSAVGTYTVVYHVRCTVHTDLAAASAPLTVTIAATAFETVSTPGGVSWSIDQRYPATASTVSYTSYGGTSSLGHDVENRFDWGDGTAFSDWTSSFAQVAKTWPTAGTYTMRRQSRCIEHPDAISEWGGDISIVVRDPETVSAPDAPVGPAVGNRYQYLYYVASGAVSSWDHSINYIEYRYDWGDGTALSAWSQTETNRGHQYTALGTYEVRTQARCVLSLHDPIESGWSAPTSVDIVEVVTVGRFSDGPDYAGVGESNDFTHFNSRSDVGHALEYQVDWGDGSVSEWDPVTVVTHAFAAAGTFDVVFRARCIEHTAAVSDWSSAHSVDVTADPEAVSTPTANHSAGGTVSAGEAVSVSGNEAVNNYGHLLEYRIDFGDGMVSDWAAASYTYGNSYLSLQHTYAASGTYAVMAQARCADHPGIESAWSAPHELVVYEGITFDGPPTGPLTGTVGESLVYTTPGATSTDGHALEYRFVYRNGWSVVATTEWSASLTDTHVFEQASGNYQVNAQARCATHTSITKASDLLWWIVITAE